MRSFGVLSCFLTVLPIPALAHAGHLIEVAGHDHLLAGAAIGIAIAIGVAGALKGAAKDDEENAGSEETDPELSEA